MSGVAMLAAPCDATEIVYRILDQAFGVRRVILEQPMRRGEFLRRRVKRLGWLKVAGQVMFRGVVVPALERSSRRRIRELKAELGLAGAPVPAGVITHVPSANAPESIAALRALQPEVVVLSGTRIVSEAVLSSVPAVFLNVHAGITPLYRGVHGGYWALVDGLPERCGVTVHRVDAGIDTGEIVSQAVIVPSRDDNFATYPYLQLGAAVPLLLRAVRDALDGALRVQPAPPGPSRLFTHPTAAQYLRYRVTRGVK